jgi:GTP cyclohydrolase II
MSTPSLFASPEQIRVERAVAELRAGRPVLLSSGDAPAHLVHAVDGLDDARLEALIALGQTTLTLSPERARWIGLAPEARQPTLIAATGLPLATLSTLVFGEKPEIAGLATSAGAAIHGAALELTRIARLVPAVLAIALEPVKADVLAELASRVSTADIAAYSPLAARAMQIVADAPVPLRPDIASRFVVFRGGETAHDQIAIVVGTPDPARPVPVRLHSACLTGDLFGSLKCDCGDQLRMAVERFAELGGGIVLYLDQEGRGIGIANKMRAYELQAEGYDTVDADARLGFHWDERRWHDAARMLDLLGIGAVHLHSNNPRKAEALTSAGITVVSREPVLARVTPENARYLKTKVERSGHLIDEDWLNRATAAVQTMSKASGDGR